MLSEESLPREDQFQTGIAPEDAAPSAVPGQYYFQKQHDPAHDLSLCVSVYSLSIINMARASVFTLLFTVFVSKSKRMTFLQLLSVI